MVLHLILSDLVVIRNKLSPCCRLMLMLIIIPVQLISTCLRRDYTVWVQWGAALATLLILKVYWLLLDWEKV